MLLQVQERAWNPWHELERMEAEISRIFGDMGMSGAPAFPALNAWTGEEDVVVTAGMPGIEPKDIEISVVDKTLTIKGERGEAKEADGRTYHRRERSFGRFVRKLDLPYRIEAGSVSAKFANGVLKVTLPRAEEDRPRKIAIEATAN